MTIHDFQKQYANHIPTLQDARYNYAVLVPLAETPQGLALLYEVRSAAIRQPGEVCFPGGRMEAGETAVTCALRETYEELGIAPEDITVLGQPDFLYLRSEGIMYPVLAQVDARAVEHIVPSADEVKEAFLLPLSWLKAHPPTVYRYPLKPMVDADFPYEAVQASPQYPWAEGQMEVPVYQGLPHPLWGLTARITKHLIENM